MDENEQDRSEEPTHFKLSRARKRGQIARGIDLGFLAALCAFYAYLWIVGPHLAKQFVTAARGALIGGFFLSDGHSAPVNAVAALISPLARPLVFLAVAVFGLVLLFELVQTGFVFSAFPLKPDFNRMNPGANLKRLFSLRLFIETLKSLLKFCCYTAVGYLTVRGILADEARHITDASSLLTVLNKVALRLLGSCILVALVIAVLDQVISRRDFLKRMRMSRRELRREVRDREGEPRQKQKRKQLHAEFTKASRSLRGIKGADVLITNPTHYAVGLKYDPRTMAAPLTVCLGMNRFAERLKRLAFIYAVPIIENRTLARELFQYGVLGGEIPSQCFQPVADIYNGLKQKKQLTADECDAATTENDGAGAPPAEDAPAEAGDDV